MIVFHPLLFVSLQLGEVESPLLGDFLHNKEVDRINKYVYNDLYRILKMENRIVKT